MPKGAIVALKPRGSRRKAAKVEAASPLAPANFGHIVRLSTASVSIESELLFDPGWEATARELLIRAFGVAEVDAVTFRRRQATRGGDAGSPGPPGRVAVAGRGRRGDRRARDPSRRRADDMARYPASTRSSAVFTSGFAPTPGRPAPVSNGALVDTRRRGANDESPDRERLGELRSGYDRRGATRRRY